MPKPIPVAEDYDRPFWDAANSRRLIIQNCTACNRLQYPPAAVCAQCNSKDNLTWKDTSGRGKIDGYCVQYDTRVVMLKDDQPFNTAIIALEEAPEIKFFSNLPGTPPDNVPYGVPVRVIFQEVAPGRLVPEWEIVK